MQSTKTLLKVVTIVIITLFSTTIFAQDAKKETQTLETKMDKFASKTGAFTKFVDNQLPNLKVSYSSPETRIRRIIIGDQITYFYQIQKSGQYSNVTASIEYSDLLEVIKALNSLKTEVEKDIALNPDYLENKFVTVDGFQIGYFVQKGKITWYLKLEKYGSDNTLFVNDVSIIDVAFNGAKSKIEELKK